jgi:hypothetical protein
MRCLSCDHILSGSEDARLFEGSGARVGLCNGCAIWVPLPTVGGDELEVEDPDNLTEPLEEEDEDEDFWTNDMGLDDGPTN